MVAQKEVVREEEKTVDYVAVYESPQFKQFLKRKQKFIIPFVIFFIIFYFTLPILTSYSTILNTPAIGDISWTWIFAIAQFVMVWTLSSIYVRKANSFDVEAEKIIRDQIK